MAGIFHDVDKLLMLMFTTMSLKNIHQRHRRRSKHHVNNITKSKKDYIQMVIDWECARFTKPDKQLNAYDTMYKFYPEMEDKLLPVMVNLKLIT